MPRGDCLIGHQTLPSGVIPTQVGLMKGGVVAFSCGRDLYYCASGSGEVVEHIENACVQSIHTLRVTPDGMTLATIVDNVKRIGLWSAPVITSAS